MLYLLIFVLAILLVYLIYRCYRDTVEIEVNQLELQFPALNGKSGTPLKIFQLSDLHFKKWGRKEKQLVQIFERLEFDLLVFTGDFIQENPQYFSGLADFLKQLEFNCPAYAVTGNHDYDLDIFHLDAVLQDVGIKLLLNENITLDCNELLVNIIGVEDPRFGRDNLYGAAAGTSKEADFNLLLAHAYDVLDSLDSMYKGNIELEIDLLLAGDTHGGQYYLGQRLTKFMHRFQFLDGLYELKDVMMYINRGIGTSVLPFRFRARPEVTLFTIKGTD